MEGDLAENGAEDEGTEGTGVRLVWVILGGRGETDVPLNCCDVEHRWISRWVVVMQVCGYIDQSVFRLDVQFP